MLIALREKGTLKVKGDDAVVVARSKNIKDVKISEGADCPPGAKSQNSQINKRHYVQE